MHFIARCFNFPELKFNSPLLHQIYCKTGRENQTTWLRFINGIFDSKVAGLENEEECLAARKALENCQKNGAYIIFPEEEAAAKPLRKQPSLNQ